MSQPYVRHLIYELWDRPLVISSVMGHVYSVVCLKNQTMDTTLNLYATIIKLSYPKGNYAPALSFNHYCFELSYLRIILIYVCTQCGYRSLEYTHC